MDIGSQHELLHLSRILETEIPFMNLHALFSQTSQCGSVEPQRVYNMTLLITDTAFEATSMSSRSVVTGTSSLP